ncbi:hypothetical protein EVJ58_g6503 [Rhodofomes roseus]|uniref:Hydrophobin n=1 Tax=Rhodofomes roseus TaxID=34475 RepID=A0A4Y9Y705_9APHY|nr:hypothetical protein EVJ58_g6503 [Rhodofomes roseus]
MQFILTFISALFAALFVRAAPAAIGSLAMRDDGSCNTGSAVCCNSVSSPDNLNNGTVSLLGVLGVNIDNLLNNIGIGCSALVGGTSW